MFPTQHIYIVSSQLIAVSMVTVSKNSIAPISSTNCFSSTVLLPCVLPPFHYKSTSTTFSSFKLWFSHSTTSGLRLLAFGFWPQQQAHGAQVQHHHFLSSVPSLRHTILFIRYVAPFQDSWKIKDYKIVYLVWQVM